MRQKILHLLKVIFAVGFALPTIYLITSSSYVKVLDLLLTQNRPLEFMVALGGVYLLLLQMLSLKLRSRLLFGRLRLFSFIGYMYLPPFISLLASFYGGRAYFLLGQNAFFSWIGTMIILAPLFLIVRQLDEVFRMEGYVASKVGSTIMHYMGIVFVLIIYESTLERQVELEGLSLFGYKTFVAIIKQISSSISSLIDLPLNPPLDLQIPPLIERLSMPPIAISATFVLTSILYFLLLEGIKERQIPMQIKKEAASRIRPFGLQSILAVGMIALAASIIALILPNLAVALPGVGYPKDLLLIFTIVSLILILDTFTTSDLRNVQRVRS